MRLRDRRSDRCATAAASAGVGSIGEAPLGPSVLVYLFGAAHGSDGNLWFANDGCAAWAAVRCCG